jgi:hypothetical protein
MDTLDKGMNYILEWDTVTFHPTAQNGTEFKTLFLSGIFYLIFSDHSWPKLQIKEDYYLREVTMSPCRGNTVSRDTDLASKKPGFKSHLSPFCEGLRSFLAPAPYRPTCKMAVAIIILLHGWSWRSCVEVLAGERLPTLVSSLSDRIGVAVSNFTWAPWCGKHRRFLTSSHLLLLEMENYIKLPILR